LGDTNDDCPFFATFSRLPEAQYELLFPAIVALVGESIVMLISRAGQKKSDVCSLVKFECCTKYPRNNKT
jgi:hypothetical protein